MSLDSSMMRVISIRFLIADFMYAMCTFIFGFNSQNKALEKFLNLFKVVFRAVRCNLCVLRLATIISRGTGHGCVMGLLYLHVLGHGMYIVRIHDTASAALYSSSSALVSPCTSICISSGRIGRNANCEERCTRVYVPCVYTGQPLKALFPLINALTYANYTSIKEYNIVE